MLMLPQYSPGSPLMPSRSVSHEKRIGFGFVPSASMRPVPVTKMDALFWTAMSFAPGLTVRISLSTYRFPLKYFVPEMVRFPERNRRQAAGPTTAMLSVMTYRRTESSP